MSAERRTSLWVVGLLVLAATSASGRTWHVCLDGSGDFADIQPAVDAAAPNDTIKIGAGRFDTFRPLVAPAWVEQAIVQVFKDNLTFIGSGVDQTIIGTVSYVGEPGDEPKAIASWGGYRATLENMTLENVEAAIYWEDGNLTVSNCAFRANNVGYKAVLLAGTDLAMSNCTFDTPSGGLGIILCAGEHRTVQSAHIDNCRFLGTSQAVSAGYRASGITVTNTSIEGAFYAIVFDGFATGAISNCHITRTRGLSLSLINGATVDVTGTVMDGGEYGMTVYGPLSQLTASNVVVAGTTRAALEFGSRALATIHSSHILPAGGLAVNCYNTNTPVIYLDLTGNYWGQSSADAVAALINDVTDDGSIHYRVVFRPFSDCEVPTETTTWGDVKAMFR